MSGSALLGKPIRISPGRTKNSQLPSMGLFPALWYGALPAAWPLDSLLALTCYVGEFSRLGDRPRLVLKTCLPIDSVPKLTAAGLSFQEKVYSKTQKFQSFGKLASLLVALSVSLPALSHPLLYFSHFPVSRLVQSRLLLTFSDEDADLEGSALELWLDRHGGAFVPCFLWI